MTDQQSADALGHKIEGGFLDTPALDLLSRESLAFENAYCAHPLCVPSRNSLFTGRYPHKIGVMVNNDSKKDLSSVPCMGKVLTDAGYDTGYVGKWHLCYSAGRHADIHGFRYVDNIRSNGADAHNVDAAVKFLDEERSDPFFLVASFNNPHNICEWARSPETGAFPDIDVGSPPHLSDRPPLRSNHSDQHGRPQILADLREAYQATNTFPVGHFGEEEWRAYRWAYYRMVESIDREIGRLLEELQRRGLAENTVVVFTSDHGDMQGAHGWNQKTTLYDESTKVPFMIRWPGVVEPGESKALIQNGIDLMPTLCAAAGVQLSEDYPGVDVLGLNSENDREFIVSETCFAQGADLGSSDAKVDGRMLRTERYKYCAYRAPTSDDLEESLTDLHEDPGEMLNLLASDTGGSLSSILDEHRRLLKTHCESQGDAFFDRRH